MALTKWQPPLPRQLLDGEGKVTWLELFFDLIYVAALIQLGDRLAGDVSWAGVLRFTGAFVILWWTWTGTTAFMNRFAVDDVPHRFLMFVQMFAVGQFAIIAATAETDRARWLPVAYIAARIPLLVMYLRVRYSLPETRDLVDLYLRSFAGSLALWALSLLVPTPLRYWVWAVALAIEFLAPIIATRKVYGLPTQNEHFQERYALLTIIVLGETFVKGLSEVTRIGLSVQTQVFGGMVSIMLIAIWWTYFDDVADSHIRQQSALSRRAASNRLAWAYTHLPLAAGITAFGVASKKMVAVESFDDAFKSSYTWLLVGALIVVLVSVAILDLVTVSPHYAVASPVRIGPRLVAAAALVPLGLLTAAGTLSALVGLGAIGLVVVVQIGVEILVAVRSDRRLNEQIRIDLTEVEGSCDDLADAETPEPVEGALECKVCHEKGEPWVYLRLCLTCDYIGCCDDSPGQHARRHAEETGHPVISSIEIGDEWAYCFTHDTVDQTWLTDRRRRNVPNAPKG